MQGAVIFLLAAGASRRMRGGDKLMETIGDEPLLRRLARAALASGARTLVGLPPGDKNRRAALEDLLIEPIIVDDASEGMAASFRAAAEAFDAKELGLMMLLGDMPDIDALDIEHLWSAFDADGMHRPVRAATFDLRPGAPVIFPARLVPRLATLTGDVGGRSILAGEDVLLVPLRGERALLDLDTPEQWSAWRAARPDS